MLKTLSSISAAATAVAVLVIAVPASHAQTPIAPAPAFPIAGKTLHRGVPFTFKVGVDPESSPSGVFLKVSKSKKVGDDGTLANEIYFRSMTAKGNFYVKRVERYKALTSHFLNRPGRYYWQAYVVDCSEGTDDCNVEGSITSFKIK